MLRAGLESALEKDGKTKKQEPSAVRWKNRNSRRTNPPSNITFNLSVNPVPIEDIDQADNKYAKNIGLDKLVRPYRDQQGERSNVKDAEEDPDPANKETPGDVFYYGSLADMGELLGLDEEDEVEPEADAPTTGWGWGWLSRS